MESAFNVLGWNDLHVGISPYHDKGESVKAVSGGQTKGMLGEFHYIHEHHRGYGHRVRWIHFPPSGMELLHGGKILSVERVGSAGALICSGKDGSDPVSLFPWEVQLSK